MPRLQECKNFLRLDIRKAQMYIAGMELRILGNTDDVTSCDCCGRTDLKSTVAIETALGAVVYYGVVCAAKYTGRAAKEIRADARKADDEKKAAKDAAAAAVRDAETRAWFSWLAENGTGPDVWTRIHSLGGYHVAKAKYRRSVTR
jgi:hypothetical protein